MSNCLSQGTEKFAMKSRGGCPGSTRLPRFLQKKKHKQHLQGRHTSCRGATVSSGALQYLQWRRRRGGEELRDYGLRTLPIVTESPNRVDVCRRPWAMVIAMSSKLVCVRKSKMCEILLFWLHPVVLAVLELREKRHYFSVPHSYQLRT